MFNLDEISFDIVAVLLATMSSVALTKSNVASTLLLVRTGRPQTKADLFRQSFG